MNEVGNRTGELSEGDAAILADCVRRLSPDAPAKTRRGGLAACWGINLTDQGTFVDITDGAEYTDLSR